MPTITIDPEFHSLIPPLTPEELSGLAESLRREGCRDPLAVWPSESRNLLLDGHNRYEICRRLGIAYHIVAVACRNRDEARVWIIRQQLSRRNLSAYQRAELALRLEPLLAAQAKAKQRAAGGALPQKSAEAHIETRRELARIAGVSHDTIKKVKVIVAAADQQTKDKLRREQVTINRAYRAVRERRAVDAREAEAAEAAAKMNGDGKEHAALYCCDLLEAPVQPESVDAIVCDPPYGAAHLELFDELGIFAAQVLRPGGCAALLCGQLYMLECAERLRKHLAYRWTAAYIVPQRGTRVWPALVQSKWKPILIFVKQGDRPLRWIVDDAISAGDEDKRFHRWGQDVSGFVTLIERLSQPGDVVCDPVCGGGTTSLAALVTGRQFIGIDRDKRAIRTTADRIARFRSLRDQVPLAGKAALAVAADWPQPDRSEISRQT